MSRPRSLPTEKQAGLLRLLASGQVVVIVPTRRDWGPLLRRGWVRLISEDDGSKKYLPPLQITLAGLRALCDAYEFEGGVPEVEWKKAGEKPPQLDEHPEVTKLKDALAESRERLNDAQRDLHYANARLRKVRYAMEGFES